MPSTFHVRNAEVYEQLMGRHSRDLAPLFLDWIGDAPGNRILDVGCGTGSLIAELLQRNPAINITALDYEQRFVNYSHAAYGTLPNVIVKQGDAEAMRYSDGQFDSTLSMLTVHFIEQPQTALKEMKRVTKPGGMVAVNVWKAGGTAIHNLFWDLAAGIDPVAAAMREKTFRNPMMNADSLQAGLRDAGLQNVTLGEVTIQMEYASFDAYWQPHAKGGNNKFLAQFAPGNAATLEAELRNAFLGGAPDGPRRFPAVALCAKGYA